MRRDFNRVLRAEKVEENADAILALPKAVNDAGQSTHGAIGDFDSVSRFERRSDFSDDLSVHFGADRIDDGTRDLAKLTAEFHNVEHVLGVADSPQRGGGVEMSEEVAGEESFDEPNFAPGGGALEFDARAIGLDAEHAF